MTAETRLVTFYACSLWIGIPIDRIREINRASRITKVPNAPPNAVGLINLRGQLVTILDLRRILGDRPGHEDRADLNVIIDSEGEEIGLLVDELGEVETYRASEVEPVPSHMKDATSRMMLGVLQRQGDILSLLDVDAALALDLLAGSR